MRVQPVDSTTFKVYKATRTTQVSSGTLSVDVGVCKDKKIEIYKMFNNKGRLTQKLYWLENIFGKLIRSKMITFDNEGNKTKILGTEDIMEII